MQQLLADAWFSTEMKLDLAVSPEESEVSGLPPNKSISSGKYRKKSISCSGAIESLWPSLLLSSIFMILKFLASLCLVATTTAKSPSFFVPSFPPVLQSFASNGTVNVTLSDVLFGNDTKLKRGIIEDVYEKIAHDDDNPLTLQDMFTFVNTSQTEFAKSANSSGILVPPIDRSVVEKASEIQMNYISKQNVSANHSITANLTQFDKYVDKVLNVPVMTLPKVCEASKREYERCKALTEWNKDVRSAFRSVKRFMEIEQMLCESGISAFNLYKTEACQLFALEDTSGKGPLNADLYTCMRQFQCFNKPDGQAKNPWNVTIPEVKKDNVELSFEVSPEALGLQSILAELTALAMKHRADSYSRRQFGVILGLELLPFPLFAIFAPASFVTFAPAMAYMVFAGAITGILLMPTYRLVDLRIMQYIAENQQPILENLQPAVE